MAVDFMSYMTIAGVALLFVILIVLLVVLSKLSAVVELIKKNDNADSIQQAPVYNKQTAVVPTVSAASALEKQKLVAAIAAAVAEDMGTDVSHLRIHSIRKI